jgi:MFS superfamily sulfate permease-like transporter
VFLYFVLSILCLLLVYALVLQQIRLPVAQLSALMTGLVSGSMTWEKATNKYPVVSNHTILLIIVCTTSLRAHLQLHAHLRSTLS